MLQFRADLYDRLLTILTGTVGPGSDPTETIKTFNKRLDDVQVESLPYLVINVRNVQKLLPGEIGNPYQKYVWTVHIYYIDMETVEAQYDVADERRDHIMAKVEKALETNKFLQDPTSHAILMSQDTDGHVEQIYDSSIQMINFDSSGQEGAESFTSELYFEVYTDRF